MICIVDLVDKTKTVAHAELTVCETKYRGDDINCVGFSYRVENVVIAENIEPEILIGQLWGSLQKKGRTQVQTSPHKVLSNLVVDVCTYDILLSNRLRAKLLKGLLIQPKSDH